MSNDYCREGAYRVHTRYCRLCYDQRLGRLLAITAAIEKYLSATCLDYNTSVNMLRLA